ncbi:hypothetical protein GGG16DRAFT_108413 [Schizophyllum commune]
MYNAPKFFAQHKADNVILVYLSPTSPPPVSVPFELQEYVSKDAWASRITTITRVASSYSKPKLEMIWAILSFLLLTVIPMAIVSVLNATLHDDDPQWHFHVREISLGIFLGMMLLFAMPMVIWKAIGQRHLNRTIQRWTQQDNQTLVPGTARANWSARLPRMFSSQIVVSIAVPHGTFPSLFHPDAYLPSFVRGPIDAQAAYYYPYSGSGGKAEPNMPHMSTIGAVPLYGNGNVNGRPPSYGYGDEKRPFGDYKRSSRDSRRSSKDSFSSGDYKIQRASLRA